MALRLTSWSILGNLATAIMLNLGNLPNVNDWVSRIARQDDGGRCPHLLHAIHADTGVCWATEIFFSGKRTSHEPVCQIANQCASNQRTEPQRSKCRHFSLRNHVIVTSLIQNCRSSAAPTKIGRSRCTFVCGKRFYLCGVWLTSGKVINWPRSVYDAPYAIYKAAAFRLIM